MMVVGLSPQDLHPTGPPETLLSARPCFSSDYEIPGQTLHHSCSYEPCPRAMAALKARCEDDVNNGHTTYAVLSINSLIRWQQA